MDKDIQEIFKEKNKEILITNLRYDLDKNIGSLFETITNIFNLEFDTAIGKIVTILEDGNLINNHKRVIEIISTIKIEDYENIDKLIQVKKNVLTSMIDRLEFEENKMNEYYDTVFETTKDIKNKIMLGFNKSANNVINLLNNYIASNINIDNIDLTYNRIEDYLKNRLYGKLETKIHMEIMLRDNNLINKAKEVYTRYQEICSKTE